MAGVYDTRMHDYSVVPESPDEDANLCCPSIQSALLSLLFPFGWLGSCKIVKPRESAVVVSWGKYVGTVKEPGCYCVNPCGLEFESVYQGLRTADLKSINTVDAEGTSIVIDGCIFWSVTSPRLAVLEVKEYATLLKNESEATLKVVCQRYAYDSSSSAPSLRSHPEDFEAEFVVKVNERLREHNVGVIVHKFLLTDLFYPPHIAKQMLVRQQAVAVLQARRVIVDGTVSIVDQAIKDLKKNGISLDEPSQAKLTKNLVLMLCSDKGGQ